MIPKVRTWKVTAVESGRTVEVMTINKRFAKWIATTDFGMYGQTLKVSLVKPKEVFSKNFSRNGFSQPIEAA
jgi:hypothetical protein